MRATRCRTAARSRSPARTARSPSGDEPGLAAGDYVVLTVADNGCGIPPELLEQVTRALLHHQGGRQGHRPRPVDGLRLRPAIGRRVPTSTARSAAAPRVEIWLPRAPTTATRRRAERAAPPSAQAPTPPLRILLVDDHDGVRETTAALLARSWATTSSRPRDGAEHARAARAPHPAGFDLIITDYAMPLISGAEARSASRARSAPTCPASSSPAMPSPASLRPAADVQILVKPFDQEQLRQSLKKARLECA